MIHAHPNSRPTVSLAIPVYNGEQYLAEAISSVLDQTVAPDEFIVYDNASTDASPAIARELLPPRSLVVRDQNVGAVENFNSAAVNSSPDATYFMWLAADDRLRPRFIESCVRELEQNPDAPACLTGVAFIDSNGKHIRTQTDLELASLELGVRLGSFLQRPRWTEFYCLYRRDALLASPIAAPRYGFDVLLTWWFLLRSPLAVVAEPLLDYRIGPEKSVEEVLKDLDPNAGKSHWQLVGLWRHLWDLTGDPELTRSTKQIARRALVRAACHPTWLVHIGADVTLRWPWLRRPALVVRDRGRALRGLLQRH